ncbi:glycoside hydrolase domain-containing protein [Akkermansia sp.]|uniref:glycoside hydrolase domain-containing protein n=1 Tax=Akkermansia sp. TaxID=1872421 RepID=UPI0025C1A7A8|nr:glycoside hydrolase domain-containing protein [Akkermansia sp.]
MYEPALVSAGAAGDAGNLFAGAKVTASGHYGNDRPELAVDGQANNAGKYWGCEGIPVWLQIDMGKPRTLSALHVWPYWEGGRIYKYKIEGSEDGRNWKMLADQSSNSIAATSEGVPFKFNPQTVRYVKITFLGNSAGNDKGGHLVEIKGYGPDAALNLQAAAVKDYDRIPYSGAPGQEMLQDAVRLSGWRGERAGGQIAVWSSQAQPQLSAACAGVKNAAGQVIPVRTSMIRYTKGGNRLISDIIGSENTCDLQAGGVRPVWVEVNIPPSAKPGVYKGKIVVSAESGSPVSVPVVLEVAPESLPAPANWQVHLDLWQHPQAVARWHDVEPWSPEHFALMKPVMKRLADAGQKAITCSLIDEAWNAQTYDWFPPMIEWSKDKNGTMRWNYANFDKWVSFMMNEVGVKGQISCYTMIPWNMKVRYLDKATGKYKFLDLKPDDPSYEAIWGPFLADFRKHVKSKGWLDKTCIALDERPDALVKAAKNVLDKYAPEFKIVSAVNRPTAMTRDVYDVSPVIDHAGTVTGDLLAQRKKEGKKTTFYVCCGPAKPNTFTHSPLAEAEWLGWFAAANNLDGFLRWAYNSWNRNPFETTNFGTFPTGDCFLVYPGNLSSLRFEKLRDGLEEFEKVNILRARAAKNPKAKAAVARMDEELSKLFTVEKSRGDSHEDDVRKAREIIRKTAEASRK